MENLRSNWHTVRILQLAMGLTLLGSYLFYMQDGITLIFAVVLLMQATFNVSCVTGACNVPQQDQETKRPVKEEVEYDEIV